MLLLVSCSYTIHNGFFVSVYSMETSGRGRLGETEHTVENDSSSFVDDASGSDYVENDPYHYTKRGEFTSELYKICVENLPHYVGYQVSVQ